MANVEPPLAIAPTHPEEMTAEFEMRFGASGIVKAKARATPAGLICAGLALAVVIVALGYLDRARRRY